MMMLSFESQVFKNHVLLLCMNLILPKVTKLKLANLQHYRGQLFSLVLVQICSYKSLTFILKQIIRRNTLIMLRIIYRSFCKEIIHRISENFFFKPNHRSVLFRRNVVSSFHVDFL